jgi:hypothetical protein
MQVTLPFGKILPWKSQLVMSIFWVFSLFWPCNVIYGDEDSHAQSGGSHKIKIGIKKADSLRKAITGFPSNPILKGSPLVLAGK